MDRLWAPWRMEYIRTPKEGEAGCIFCDKSKSANDKENLVVFRGEHSFALMNLYPYNNGHLLIAPFDHEAEFDRLAPGTQVEMMQVASRAMRIMRRVLRAEGFNFGANFGEAAGAGIKEHVHLHIVPRWKGDTNFMPIIGHNKVQVDGLSETCMLLKKEFSKE